MTNSIKINGTGIRCKGNVKGHYEQVPGTIFTYLELGLISGNELAVYLLLLKFDNKEYGYAFPTTKQLAIRTGVSDRTAKQAIKTLETVGLIKIEKAPNFANKNRYFVYLPHEKDVLKKQVPHLFTALEKKTAMYSHEADQDKQRLKDYRNQSH